MSPTQIKRLHDEGMEIGGHTVNHPNLLLLDEQQAREEIVGGKCRLEEITGAPLTLFAFPFGRPGRTMARGTYSWSENLDLQPQCPRCPAWPIAVVIFSSCRALYRGTGIRADLELGFFGTVHVQARREC